MTTWKGRAGTQSNRGFLTDSTGSVLADNTLNKISFRTGISVNVKSKWKNAR